MSSLVGSVSHVCQNGHVAYSFQNCGIIPLIYATLFLSGMLLPYIIAISRNIYPAFIPFVSQAAAVPPMCGPFAIAYISAAFVGLFLFPVFHQSIRHRISHKSRTIKIASIISLTTAVGGLFGGVIVSAFPEGFTQGISKFEYMVTVLLGHGVGAILVFTGVWVFTLFRPLLYFYLPEATKVERGVGVVLMVASILSFPTSVKPMSDFLMDEFGPEPFNIQLLKNSTYDLPLVYNTSYKIAAVCEWLILSIAVVNIYSLYKDFQKISFHVVLRRKSSLRLPHELSTIIPKTNIVLPFP